MTAQEQIQQLKSSLKEIERILFDDVNVPMDTYKAVLSIVSAAQVNPDFEPLQEQPEYQLEVRSA